MKFYTLIAIITVSFFLNGCLADRIKQRLFPEKKQQVARQVNDGNKTEKVQPVKRKAVEPKKTYTPSKPTAPIYTEPKPKVINKVKSSNKSYKKKKSHKKKVYKKKVHKIKPEPYSIGKDEADPELLGPQTTIESNPLTKNSKKADKKKKSKI